MKSLHPRVVLLAGICFAVAFAHGQDFSTNVETKPSPQAAAIAEANAALAAGEYARALKLLAPLAAADPHNALLAYDLGSSQDALDQTQAAEQSYRAAIADNPAMLEPRVALGLLLARSGQLPQARSELAAAVALPQADAAQSSHQVADNALRARAYRALARLDQKQRPADARDELLAALKLSPETPEDTLLTAELAQAASNGAAPAEAAYRRVLAADPGNPEASAALAHLLAQQNHPDEAEAVLRTGLKIHPTEPTMSMQLAALLGRGGNQAKALPLVESLHTSDPANPDISRALSRLYLATGDDAKAEPLLAMLIALHPRDTSLIDDRARALIHLKRFAEAQQLLSPVVAQPELFATKADLGDAATDLAFAASENNDPAATLQALAIRATVLPPSPPVLFLAAISHDHLHQVQAAREAYRQFLTAAKGTLPDQESEARHRLITLDHMH